MTPTRQTVHCRLEVDVELELSAHQLAGEDCAICGSSFLLPGDLAERLGDVAGEMAGAYTVLTLMAHDDCKLNIGRLLVWTLDRADR